MSVASVTCIDLRATLDLLRNLPPAYKRGDVVWCYAHLFDGYEPRIGIVLSWRRPSEGVFDFYTVLVGDYKEEFVEFILDPVVTGSATIKHAG